MSKRRVPKVSKRSLSCFGPICLIIIVYFSFSLLYNIYTIYELTVEKKQLEEKYVKLQEEAEQLKIDIEKLNDPEYLANYARENYLYSKSGEYIIQMGDEYSQTTEKIDTINTTINKNYLIIGLCVLVFLIFIYILSKGKKKK